MTGKKRKPTAPLLPPPDADITPGSAQHVLQVQLQAAAHTIQSAYRKHRYHRGPLHLFEELKILFKQYDTDGDGHITLDEPVNA